MAVSLEFCLLGPLVVRRDGVDVPVPAGKPRAVLAALLLGAGDLVTVNQLAEVLWGGHPPPSARVSVQNHVKRLRQALGDAGRARIRTQPGGYVMDVAAGELDVSRFQASLAEARVAARDRSWEQASAQASAAMLLWRGEPLAGVDSELLARQAVPYLAEIRLQAWETRLEAEVELGHYGDAIAELRRLIAEYPLSEHPHALLMMTLHRCGRHAEALAVYQATRRILIDQLGAEPGPELRQAHQRVLDGDQGAAAAPDPRAGFIGAAGPTLPGDAPAGAAAAPKGGLARTGAEPVVPRQLPGPVRQFVGRDSELAALTALLDRAGTTPHAVLISAIGGMAGVGKTALAVRWAHQIAERFPDGQLYVNLRGYDLDEPLPAADVLAGFLRDLGVPGPDIPAGCSERAARFRSLLAGRRMLVVLDNAAQAEQVRPFLAGSPGCVTLVTSRKALAGLVARDGAVRLDLDLLPRAGAVELLRALIGARVDADPAAADALAARCARLPLALRVAAELAAARPVVSLAELAGELADQQRLDMLDAGEDPRAGIRAVFSWSCKYLDADAARLFRLVSLHPGLGFGVQATAALAATTAVHARRLLDGLARAHLVQAAAPGRYALHDLLRAYARELASIHDGEGEQRAALTRLFDYYLQASAAAMDTLFPAEAANRPAIAPPAGCALPPVENLAAAREWLDGERANLAATAMHTAAHGWPGHAISLAATLFRYLDAGGHFAEAVIIHRNARDAAAQIADPNAEADALTSLGLVDLHQGRYLQATAQLQQALALSRETGDRNRQARALQDLGLGDFQQGRWPQAAGQLEQAMDLFGQTGDRIGQARVLGNLGIIAFQQGRPDQAAGHLHQALAVYRQASHPAGEAYILANLGGGELLQGRYQQATSHLQQALPLFRETGNRTGEAHVLANLGIIDLRHGRCQQATSSLQQALDLFRQTSDRSGEAEALNGLGEVLLVTGEPERARNQHANALALTTGTGDIYEQARAHHGLARCCPADDVGLSRRHLNQALTLYSSLGAPEADQIRTQLAAGDTAPSR
jgi:DNA-binding SARP family transcriptional activator/Tfp pilus assembly protein PilF